MFWFPETRPRISLVTIAMSVFGIIVSLATIFSLHPMHSFWSNFERMEGLVTYLHLGLYWLVLSSVFTSERLWRVFFSSSIGVSLIVCIYGFFQLAGKLEIHQGSVRLDATLGNAIYLAVYLLIHLFLTLYLMMGNRSKSWQIIGWIAVIIQAVVLYFTATRGAILGLIGGLIVTGAILIIRPPSPSWRRRSLYGLGVIVLLVAAFIGLRQAAFVQNSPVLSRFANISAHETTTESRLIIWQMSLKGFTEHPLLGWGPENYNIVFNKYYDPRLWPQEQWFDRSHNIFLDWLISAGALGLISYLSLFGVSLYYLWSRRRLFTPMEYALLTGMLAAYFFHNIFVFDNLVSYIFFMSILAYIHFRVVATNPELAKLQIPVPISSILSVLAVIIFGATVYFVVAKPLDTATKLIEALSSRTAEASLNYFDQTLTSSYLGRAEARLQMLSTAYQVLRQPAVSTSTKQEFVSRTISEQQAQLAELPDEARYTLFFGSFLDNLGYPKEGLVLLEKAAALSPRKQTIKFELISNALQQNQVDQALTIAKEAFELDPSFPEARRIYGLLLLQKGKYAEADEVLTYTNPRTGAVLELDERFINMYAQLKRYDKVLQLWQTKVAADPNNVQDRFSLAAAYLATGDRGAAIKEINSAISIDPGQRTFGEQLIKEIQAGRNPLVQ
jgi:O-antigen ligase/Tfp pilus assembly protein PilF